MDAKTTSEVAKLFGVTANSIARVCAKHGIGTVVNPRLRLLSSEDIERLKGLVHSKPGNPNFAKQKAGLAKGPAKKSPSKSAAKTAAKKKPGKGQPG